LIVLSRIIVDFRATDGMSAHRLLPPVAIGPDVLVALIRLRGICRVLVVPLKYFHPDHRDSHMKTTLNIDDTVMAELKREAARQGRTMSELVETALRNLFRSRKEAAELSPLPVFHSGGAFVDIADRDALYQAMEGR
jgi:hypothetical protein